MNKIFIILFAFSFCAPIYEERILIDERVLSQRIEKSGVREEKNIENVEFISPYEFTANVVSNKMQEEIAVKVVERTYLVERKRPNGWFVAENIIAPSIFLLSSIMFVSAASGTNDDPWEGFEIGITSFFIAIPTFIFSFIGIIDAIRAIDYEQTFPPETIRELHSLKKYDSEPVLKGEAQLYLPEKKEILPISDGKIAIKLPLMQYYDYFSIQKKATLLIDEKTFEIDLNENKEFLKFLERYEKIK